MKSKAAISLTFDLRCKAKLPCSLSRIVALFEYIAEFLSWYLKRLLKNVVYFD